MRVWSLGPEDPLKKEMATCFSILAWEIPWTEEPGSLQDMRSQKSWTWLSDWVCVRTCVHTHTHGTRVHMLQLKRFCMPRLKILCAATSMHCSQIKIKIVKMVNFIMHLLLRWISKNNEKIWYNRAFLVAQMVNKCRRPGFNTWMGTIPWISE